MEWNASSQPILSCTFSFDETSIFSVDGSGQLSQDSVHKPGNRIDSYPLQGFTSSTLSSAMMMATTSSSTSIRSVGGSSIRSKSFLRATSSGGSVHSAAHVPRIQLESTAGAVGSAVVDVSASGDVSGGGSGGPPSPLNDRASSTGTSGNSRQGITNAKDATSTLIRMNVGPGQLLGWSGDTDHVVMGCGNAGVIVQVRKKRVVAFYVLMKAKKSHI